MRAPKHICMLLLNSSAKTTSKGWPVYYCCEYYKGILQNVHLAITRIITVRKVHFFPYKESASRATFTCSSCGDNNVMSEYDILLLR